jgi:hypothetical protein
MRLPFLFLGNQGRTMMQLMKRLPHSGSFFNKPQSLQRNCAKLAQLLPNNKTDTNSYTKLKLKIPGFST